MSKTLNDSISGKMKKKIIWIIGNNKIPFPIPTNKKAEKYLEFSHIVIGQHHVALKSDLNVRATEQNRPLLLTNTHYGIRTTFIFAKAFLQYNTRYPQLLTCARTCRVISPSNNGRGCAAKLPRPPKECDLRNSVSEDREEDGFWIFQQLWVCILMWKLFQENYIIIFRYISVT